MWCECKQYFSFVQTTRDAGKENALACHYNSNLISLHLLHRFKVIVQNSRVFAYSLLNNVYVWWMFKCTFVSFHVAKVICDEVFFPEILVFWPFCLQVQKQCGNFCYSYTQRDSASKRKTENPYRISLARPFKIKKKQPSTLAIAFNCMQLRHMIYGTQF